ncbi:MAG: LysR family transcriptional regulator [Paracoccaceae bacterium]|nr:LysR family transcriptional regulator [Paracoccaceae bacterium]
MEFRQLRYFVAVAEEQNIGRAAERLNVSQPPISRQIQALEHELKATLLIRTSKGVELTDAGKTFLADAQKILAQAGSAVARTQAAEKGELGRLDVAFFGSTVYRVVPFALRKFHQEYPETQVSLVRMGKREQIGAIADGRIHIGFGRFYSPTSGLKIEQLTSEALFAAVPEDSALARREELTLADLTGLPAVLFPSGDRPSFADTVLQYFLDAGLSIEVTDMATDSTSALALVSAGERFTIVPQAIASLAFPTIAYVPLANTALTAPSACVYRADNQPPVLKAFLNVLRGVDFGG